MLRYQILEAARSYVGQKGWTMPSNWCARFVHDIYYMCGAAKYFYNGGKCDSCTTLMKYYKNHTPKNCHRDLSKAYPGDLVFYQFDTDEKADHIGIFDELSTTKNKFWAVEGNTRLIGIGDQATGNRVARRERKLSQVMLIVHIDFSDDNGNKYPLPTRTIKKGCKGEDVKWVQRILSWNCGYNISVDGSCGAKTEAAIMNYQRMKGNLDVDGKVGGNTRRSLESE